MERSGRAGRSRVCRPIRRRNGGLEVKSAIHFIHVDDVGAYKYSDENRTLATMALCSPNLNGGAPVKVQSHRLRWQGRARYINWRWTDARLRGENHYHGGVARRRREAATLLQVRPESLQQDDGAGLYYRTSGSRTRWRRRPRRTRRSPHRQVGRSGAPGAIRMRRLEALAPLVAHRRDQDTFGGTDSSS